MPLFSNQWHLHYWNCPLLKGPICPSENSLKLDWKPRGLHSLRAISVLKDKCGYSPFFLFDKKSRKKNKPPTATIYQSWLALALPHRCDGRSAELKGQALYLPLSLHSFPHLWSWRVMTERIRSRTQAAEMGFLGRAAGVSLGDKVRCSVIHEELAVKLLLLYAERSQLKWIRHLVRTPPGRLPVEEFQACSAGRRPRSRPRSRWRDDISALTREHLGIPQSELADVARDDLTWLNGCLCDSTLDERWMIDQLLIFRVNICIFSDMPNIKTVFLKQDKMLWLVI